MQINTFKKKKEELLALTPYSAGHRSSLGYQQWTLKPLVSFLLKKYWKHHQDCLIATTKKSKISVKP